MAIACQGGGSHTAFTAGVLDRLLRPEITGKYDIIALSGTSGGAICALLAWSALLDGDPTLAGPRLAAFWRSTSAATPLEMMINNWIVTATHLADYVAVPAISPYDTINPVLAQEYFRGLVEDAADFDRLATLAAEKGDRAPVLLLGAVDVRSGEFKAFDSRRKEITPEAVLASTAIPTIYRSVSANGQLYWDGLFSQNPPVHDLLDTGPDEIWVIQINAQRRPEEPKSLVEIADRRNELAGNLSLYQELHFIERIDRMLEQGVLIGSRYRPITVRLVEMARSRRSHSLGAASKLDRNPRFLAELIEHGQAKADKFAVVLDFERRWQDGDVAGVLDYFDPACEISSAPPMSDLPPTRGMDAVRDFVTRQLTGGVRVDPTRIQITSDTVTWRIRSTNRNGDRIEGEAAVHFRDRRIVAFHIRGLEPSQSLRAEEGDR